MKLEHILRPAQVFPTWHDPSAGGDLNDIQPDWKHTFTGMLVPVTQPAADRVSLLEMAVSLAGLNRFDNHTFLDWPVGPHSVMACNLVLEDRERAREALEGYVATFGSPTAEWEDADTNAHAELVEEAQRLDAINALDLLLHDGHEYIVGDTTNPNANAFEMLCPGFRKMLKSLKRGWDEAIYQHLGLPSYHRTAREEIVHEYDFKCLFLERDHFMSKSPFPWFRETEFSGLHDAYTFAAEFINEMSRTNRWHKAKFFLVRLDSILDMIDHERAQGKNYIETDLAHAKVAEAILKLDAVVKELGESYDNRRHRTGVYGAEAAEKVGTHWHGFPRRGGIGGLVDDRYI